MSLLVFGTSLIQSSFSAFVIRLYAYLLSFKIDGSLFEVLFILLFVNPLLIYFGNLELDLVNVISI